MQEDLLLVESAHQDNLKEMMRQMIVSETFADVTLVGDDKKYIKAHKVILSACSPFLKSILQMDTDTNNAMIYLEGIQYAEIESLLQFVYFGEATLSKERVNDIISMSKTLQIEELSNWYEDPHPHDATHEDLIAKPVGLAATTLRASRKTNESPIDANVHSVKSKNVEYVCMKCGEQFSTKNFLKKHNQYVHESDPTLKVKMISNAITSRNEEWSKSIDQNQPVDPSMVIEVELEPNKSNETSDECANEFEDTNNIDESTVKLGDTGSTVDLHTSGIDIGFENTTDGDVVKDGSKFMCGKCGSKFSYRRGVIQHLHSAHEGKIFECDQCNYKAKLKHNLNRHIEVVHKGVMYHCSFCDYRTGWGIKKHVCDRVRFNCSQCEKQFPGRKSLKQHVQSVHKGLKMVRNMEASSMIGHPKTKLYCVRGCGSQFVKEDACKRHESYCTFTAK